MLLKINNVGYENFPAKMYYLEFHQTVARVFIEPSDWSYLWNSFVLDVTRSYFLFFDVHEAVT